MRDYAKVAPTFWTGDTGRELVRRGYQGTIVGAYLMTSPHANMIGLYYQPLLYMAHETGLGLEGACVGLQTCIDLGFCQFDAATEMVWVREMAAWQIAKELKEIDLRCKGIQKEYDALQQNPFLGDFFDRYAKPFHMKTRRENKGLPKGLPKPLRSQEQEQEQEQQEPRSKSLPQKSSLRKAKPEGDPDRFAEFWAPYPRKVDRADAVKAFRKLTADQVALAIEAIPAHVAHWQAEGREPKYIPHGATWLNGHSWLDELAAAPRQRRESPKLSRQAAIAQTLLQDSRYAHTAARQPGLALSHGDRRPADAHPVVATVPAGGGHDPGDGDGVDEGAFTARPERSEA